MNPGLDATYPAAGLQFQTKIGDKWMPIVTVSTECKDHFLDLVSDETIKDVLAVKPYQFGKPTPAEERWCDDDPPTVDIDGRALTFHGFVKIDPETFEIKPAENAEDALRLVWVGVEIQHDVFGVTIAAGKGRWWRVVPAEGEDRIESGKLASKIKKLGLEAGLKGAHVEMAWTPWDRFSDVDNWEQINGELKLTQLDEICIDRCLELAEKDPETWWDEYDYAPRYDREHDEDEYFEEEEDEELDEDDEE